jgi:hypothetical protein
MAHFAKLDSKGIVEQVIVLNDSDTTDNTGLETEAIGVAFCQKIVGSNTVWKQTSYNNNMRGNYAGIGYTYMSNVATLGVGSTDIFISQQPHVSWTIGVGTAQWYPPTNPGAAPALSNSDKTAGKYYVWNESNYQSNPSTAWVLTTP